MSNALKTRLYKAVLLSMVFTLSGVTLALAGSGDLDTTFDGDGLVTTEFLPGKTEVITAIAIQPNGQILAAGYLVHNTSDFALTRYNTNGSLDAIFSKRRIDFGGLDTVVDLALQSNGKIVLSGYMCNTPLAVGGCDLALARYNSNGSLDTSFSGDGKLTTDFNEGANGSYGGLAILSNGKIIVAGFMDNAANDDFAVYRYLPNGTLDTTFSGDGMVNIAFGVGQEDDATDMVIQSDGKILIAGVTSASGTINYNFAIARLNANGTLDTTFSGDGKQTTDFGGGDIAYALALQPDGKIVVVGQKRSLTSASGPSMFAIARYNPNGNLDNTFGQLLPTGKRSGKRVFSIVAGLNLAQDVLVQSDGKIVVAGTTQESPDLADFALARLIPNGGFDTTFGQGGKVVIDFDHFDSGSALARQPSDGKYVLGGFAFDPLGEVQNFALARVLP